MTTKIVRTAAEQIAFNRFLTEVAPKLEGQINVVLTAEEVLLAVQGLNLSSRDVAAAKGITLRSAENLVFEPFYNGLDADTQRELLAALDVATTPDTPTTVAPGNLAKGLDLIGQIIVKSGSIISNAISLCASKVWSVLTTVYNWSAARATEVYNYVSTVTIPWAQRTSIAIWDWTSNGVVKISKAAWSCICTVANAVKKVFNTIFQALLGVLTAVDNKLGAWMMPGNVMQMVMLTSNCTLSLQHTVVSTMAGCVYINVLLQTAADLVTLRAEIAGAGSLL